MSGVVLDIILALVLLAYAVAGYGRGLFATALAAVGFVAGGVLGLMFVPELLQRFLPPEASSWRPILLVLLVLVTAVIGQSIVSRIGLPAAASIRRSGLRVIDSVLGSVLTVVVAALTAWVAAGVLALAPAPALRDAIDSSRVLAAIDDVVPARRADVIEHVLVAMDAYRFPQVFDNGQAPDLGAVGTPGEEMAEAPGVEQAADSIYRVNALAPRCGRAQEGTGWALERDLVVTNAHVVAGADNISIRAGNRTRSAQIVAFDPDRDLALLTVDGLDARPLALGTDVGAGTPVVLAGYPLGGSYSAESGRIGMRTIARGSDIYGQQNVTRDIYAVRGRVQPGNSGGPALTSDGRVVGVVFARSLDDADTTYALTLDELNGMLAERPQPGAEGVTACAA